MFCIVPKTGEFAPFWWSYSNETHIRRFSIIELVGVEHIIIDPTRRLVAVLPEIDIKIAITPPSGHFSEKPSPYLDSPWPN